MLNSVTKLGAELVGRSYGGGILKVEPKEAGSQPAPQSGKSYVATPKKEGEAVPASPTTPEAGKPPAQAETRRDGSESKPDVVIDKDNKSS